MTDVERCKAALQILETLNKKAIVSPVDGWQSTWGAQTWQEMQDCLDAAFYQNPPDVSKLQRLRDETTNAKLYDLLDRYLRERASSDSVGVKPLRFD